MPTPSNFVSRTMNYPSEIIRDKKITVYPKNGQLSPMGSQIIMFTFEQNNKPIFWEGEISFNSHAVAENIPKHPSIEGKVNSLDCKPNAKRCSQKIKVKNNFLRVNISTDLEVV